MSRQCPRRYRCGAFRRSSLDEKTDRGYDPKLCADLIPALFAPGRRVRPMNRDRGLRAVLAACVALGGCASYHPLPLPRRPDLATSLAQLDLSLPRRGARAPAFRVDIAKPLSLDQIGLLAILNNPDLKSAPGEIGVARGRFLQATLLPNPSASFSYGALLGGPGITSAITASLAQDIAALIVHDARVRSARARVYQVDADLLWREWQVAQKARQLAVDLYWGERAIALTRRESELIAGEIAQVRTAIAAGNLTIAALSPLLAAQAAAAQSLAAQQLARLKDWQALDALLGLVPNVRFAIARPVFGSPPACRSAAPIWSRCASATARPRKTSGRPFSANFRLSPSAPPTARTPRQS